MKLTIADILRRAIEYLKTNGVKSSAALDAQLILCHLLNADRLYLITHSNAALDIDVIDRYNRLIADRSNGMPTQYIIGVQEFMSLPFKVTADVLIPRADTETIVEYIIKEHKKKKKEHISRILDIGSGSGCIGVSLAHYISNCNVVEIDISSKALEIAEQNAYQNKVDHKMTFIKHDILKSFPSQFERQSFDVIVSNPPYIPTRVIHHLQKEVKDYEPFIALDGGEDGLVFYRRIIDYGCEYLKPGGLLAFEVGHDQYSEVTDLIKSTEVYDNIETSQDLAGFNRVVAATRRPILSKF